MDLNNTGKFIKEQRKKKNLTQMELATKLNVSEKTISKWECSLGFPDTGLILPLCEALDISANELLSGQKLDDNETYRKKAEENIFNLKRLNEKHTKFLLLLEIVLGVYAIAFMLGLSLFASFADLPDWARIVLIVASFVSIIPALHFCLLIERDAGFYECPNCHHKYIPTYSQMLWSQHMGRTRKMQCPNCHKKGWHKKVLK